MRRRTRTYWLSIGRLPCMLYDWCPHNRKANYAMDMPYRPHNRQARALLAQSEGKSSAELEEAFGRYRRVADEKDASFAVVATSWHALHGRYGRALRLARKAIKDFGAGTSSSLEELNKARALER